MYEYLENFTNNLLNKAKSTKLPSLDDNLMFQGFLKKIHTIKQIERDLITKLEIDKTIGIEPYQLDKLPNVIELLEDRLVEHKKRLIELKYNYSLFKELTSTSFDCTTSQFLVYNTKTTTSKLYDLDEKIQTYFNVNKNVNPVYEDVVNLPE